VLQRRSRQYREIAGNIQGKADSRVIPAKAEIHGNRRDWIPASAGMT
jgi:hypothetical protein